MTTEPKNKILEFLNHERYQVVSAIVCIVIVFYGMSCESKVSSLYDPQIKVTRGELSTEVQRFIDSAEYKYATLDKKDELKALLYDYFMLWTQTGAFNPIALLPTVFSILGVGAITDNVRLRKNARTNLREYVATAKDANETTTAGNAS